MAIGRRFALPLLDASARKAIVDRTPRVDAVRRQLGGRAESFEGMGTVVQVVASIGVLMLREATQAHVLLDGGVVKRVPIEQLLSCEQPIPPAVAAVAMDAKLFATLHEGQRVEFQSERGLEVGTLVEKCRYGALVLRDDGSILGVGFRKLTPAPVADEPS